MNAENLNACRTLTRAPVGTCEFFDRVSSIFYLEPAGILTATQGDDFARTCDGLPQSLHPSSCAMNARREQRARQTLVNKFRLAWRGFRRGVRSESNFFVHLFMAAMVVAGGWVLGCTLIEWCVLVLCIATVLSMEMMNTAVEHLAKAVSEKKNPFIADALDMASAAVLLASIGAAIVGTIVLGNRLGLLLRWWDG